MSEFEQQKPKRILHPTCFQKKSMSTPQATNGASETKWLHDAVDALWYQNFSLVQDVLDFSCKEWYNASDDLTEPCWPLYSWVLCFLVDRTGSQGSIFKMWERDNTVHGLDLPYPLCKQLLSLLILSTKQLPLSQRSLNSFHVSCGSLSCLCVYLCVCVGGGGGQRKWKFLPLWMSWTHSMPQNEALIPCSCAHAALRMRPSFHELYFCCHGKHSQTETGFKMNYLLLKGENSYHFLLHFFDVLIRENWWLDKEIFIFWSTG